MIDTEINMFEELVANRTFMIANEVFDFLVRNFRFGDAAGLSRDASLLGTGTIDSTGVLELVMHLERTFGIAIRDQDLIPENLDSVERIARFVNARLGCASAAGRECPP